MNILINIICTIFLLLWGGMIIMSPMMIAAHGFRDSRSSIITAILVIGSPIFAFGLLYLLGYRYFGINPFYSLLIAAFISGGVILIYGLPGMLFNLQKGIPNSGYFSKGSAVYLDGRKIKEADAASFEVMTLDEYYAKDQNNVFFYGKVVAGADPKTFAAVKPPVDASDPNASSDRSPLYWKDAQHVYFNGKPMEGADATSFVHFSGLYSKDSSRVYYQERIVETAIPEKFRIIHTEGVATDGSAVFIYGKRSKLSIDLESFKVVEGENDTYYKDKNNVYVLRYHQEDPLAKVEGADPLTFQPLDRNYAVDKDHVYYYGYSGKNKQTLTRLEGVSPKNFRVGYDEATDSEATDGKRFFMYGKEVKPGK